MGCDFTYSHYREILNNALEANYQFSCFHNTTIRPAGRTLYLRHDIDVLLSKAIEMAKIEAEMGIRATYFVLLNTPLYNPFEERDLALLQKIASLGHWLGLHVDLAMMPSLGSLPLECC